MYKPAHHRHTPKGIRTAVVPTPGAQPVGNVPLQVPRLSGHHMGLARLPVNPTLVESRQESVPARPRVSIGSLGKIQKP